MARWKISSEKRPSRTDDIARPANPGGETNQFTPPISKSLDQDIERYRHALDAAGQGVWDVNLETDEAWYSDYWYKMRGFEKDDPRILGTNGWLERIHPDDRDKVALEQADYNAGKEIYNRLEYREKNANGEWIWILSRGRTIETNPNGVPKRMIGTDTDITAVKMKEFAAAQKAKELYKAHIAALERANKNAKAAHDSAEQLANQDYLTGIANRRRFNTQLHAAIQTKKGTSSFRYLLFLDLDEFKPINDKLGHAIGDQVLCETARRIKTKLCPNDLFARMGGDEFALLVHQDSLIDFDDPRAKIECLAKDIIAEICRPLMVQNKELVIGVSIGVTEIGAHLNNVDRITKAADMAMYWAKEAGGNTYRWTQEIDQRSSA